MKSSTPRTAHEPLPQHLVRSRDCSTYAPAKRDFVAGLQFAFDLPYKGYIDVAPLAYKEINHNAFDRCGLFGPGIPGVTCIADGNTDFENYLGC